MLSREAEQLCCEVSQQFDVDGVSEKRSLDNSPDLCYTTGDVAPCPTNRGEMQR